MLTEFQTLEEITRCLIRDRLRQFDGNRTTAAASLGISVRTLQRIIKRRKLYYEFPPQFGAPKKLRESVAV